MENLSLLDLQIILTALMQMPENDSKVVTNRVKLLISNFEVLIKIRENKQ
ncbi:MAG: hypothetical protein LBQ28_04710 [Prevotellaceae bacterium]|jgi:hypothetical protein|nr:hypothetical protein [Prevotellaceae bacterium]